MAPSSHDIHQLISCIRGSISFTVILLKIVQFNSIDRFQITSVIHTLLFIHERPLARDYVSLMLAHVHRAINRSRFSKYRQPVKLAARASEARRLVVISRPTAMVNPPPHGSLLGGCVKILHGIRMRDN